MLYLRQVTSGFQNARGDGLFYVPPRPPCPPLRTCTCRPAALLDLRRVTAGCGPACTFDGLHYGNATYDTAVQFMAAHLALDEARCEG